MLGRLYHRRLGKHMYLLILGCVAMLRSAPLEHDNIVVVSCLPPPSPSEAPPLRRLSGRRPSAHLSHSPSPKYRGGRSSSHVGRSTSATSSGGILLTAVPRFFFPLDFSLERGTMPMIGRYW